MKLWTDLLNLLKAPVVGKLDTVHLFILIGLVLFLILVWLMILKHFGEVAEEI